MAILMFIGTSLVFPLALAAIITRLVLTFVESRRIAAQSAETRRAHRAITAAFAVASVIAVGAAAYLFATDEYGRGYLLIPGAILLCLQLGLAAATAIISTTVRGDGSVRVAGLAPRGISTSTPRNLVTVAAIAIALAVITAVTACSVASIDDYTGEFRRFGYATGAGSYRSFGPFPGTFYTVPLLGVLAISIVIGAATVIGAARWGALNQLEADVALRLSIATRTVATSTMIAGSIALLESTMLATAALEISGSPDDSWMWAIGRVGFPIAAVVSFAALAWAFVVFLFPLLSRRAAATTGARP